MAVSPKASRSTTLLQLCDALLQEQVQQGFLADASLVRKLPNLQAELVVYGEIMALGSNANVEFRRLLGAGLGGVVRVPEFADSLAARRFGCGGLTCNTFLPLSRSCLARIR
jgi:hypothetical protein